MKPHETRGRKALPRSVGGASVDALWHDMARHLVTSIHMRLLSGEVTLALIAESMGSEPHIIAGYLADPTRVNSLRHVAALALAAGVRVRLEVGA